MSLRAAPLLLGLLPLASCAVGAGATIGLHYTTNHSLRVQLELPLEADLVGSGTSEARRGSPYMRGAVIPQVFYDTKAGTFDGGVRAAGGPVFHALDRWVAPAFTAGLSTFNIRKLSVDFGVTVDVETPFSNGASCDDLRFNNLLAPQISVTRHTYDDGQPLTFANGDWDFGIAAGIRHTRFLSCGGNSGPPTPRAALPTADG